MIKTTVALCLCLFAVTAPLAIAQSPSQSGYGETHVLPASSTPSAGVRSLSSPVRRFVFEFSERRPASCRLVC